MEYGFPAGSPTERGKGIAGNCRLVQPVSGTPSMSFFDSTFTHTPLFADYHFSYQ
jgi:hypothetical protein